MTLVMLDVPAVRALAEYLAADDLRTQRWLGKVLHVGQSTISLWIRGAARPSLAHVIALQFLTGIPVDAWLTEEERQIIATVSVDAHRLLHEPRVPRPVKVDPRQLVFPAISIATMPPEGAAALLACALDPDNMHGAGDGFGGEDFPSGVPAPVPVLPPVVSPPVVQPPAPAQEPPAVEPIRCET
jgi:transcriptional regulator with XRE-family HTH domain